MYRATHPVESAELLRQIMGTNQFSQVNKIIDHVDGHCRNWIERSTFLLVASCSASGKFDVSPKGDPAGFVKVLDSKTLAIPERIGNRRGDTFLNVIENPNAGLLFVVPKRVEVLRISGTVQVVRDPELMGQMVAKGHTPELALLLHVKEAFFHCGKSMLRSQMWNPESWGSVEGLPTYAQVLKDHGNLPNPIEELEDMIAHNEKERMY